MKVVFIHGMFVTARCWSAWIDRWGARGWDCTAPAWPGRDAHPQALRERHPDPALGQLGLGAVLDHLDGVVRAMPEAPALVGHSMGGLLVQLLLQRGLGACGVAIDPAPPKGVFVPSWSFLRSNWPVVSPFAGDAPYLMPFEHWVYTFAHRLPEAEARAAYDAHVVPESRNVARGPTTDVALIDFKKRRAPLLILAGSDDRIVPAALNRKNHACYAGADAITDFHEFAGRTHYLIGAPGWEEVADHAAGWIESTLS